MTTTNARIFARVQRLTAACTVPLALLALIAVACGNEPQSSNRDVREGFTSRTSDMANHETPTLTPAMPTPVMSTPTALPDSPQIFSERIQRLMPWVECHSDRMAGAFQRPRVGPYAEVKYQSEVFVPGQTASREDRLVWQETYLVPVFTTEMSEECLVFVPPDFEWTTEVDHFVAEFGKNSSHMLSVALLSPWMAENCFEWQRTKGINHVSLRTGSVNRRGEQSGLFFDWHYGKAYERLLGVCAAHQ